MACWGFDGNSRTSPASSPQGVDANTRFLALSAGDFHSCGIKTDNTVACWGFDGNGQASPTGSPQSVDANTGFLAVSAGGAHSCGIKTDNTVACWGFDGNGQASPTSSPQGVDANTRFFALSAGGNHSCGIKTDNTVACWGFDGNGQASPTGSPQGVDANTRFFALSAGAAHSCAIKADSSMACWGFVGDSRTSPTASQQGIDADTRFLAVSAGGAHSCGIKADGRAACWGFSRDGQTSPPSDSFNQTPDVFRLAERTTALATQGGGKAIQFNEVTEVEPLHPQLMLREGETATLALFRVLSGPANPITITLAIEGSGKRFLSLSSTQLTINEEGGTATASVTAIDNEDVAAIDPINIALSITGDNARLIPPETITVAIEDDDVYAIGFEREALTLAEGASATARLSITPAPLGDNIVAVALLVSDSGQLTVEPAVLAFSAASASFDVAVSVIDDAIPELEKIFTVSLRPSAGIPAMTTALSVVVPADSDTPIVRVMAERAVIPEGATASVFIDAVLNRELNIGVAASGLTGSQSDVIFSPSYLTLSVDEPSASFGISVADNKEPQGNNRIFNVDLIAASVPQFELSSLTFTIPPNDLTAYAAMRAEFTLEEPERTLTINITPELRGSKSFLVFSADSRLTVNAGIITPAQSPFPIDLALSEDAVLGREERLNLNISHLDIWQPFTQPSAQVQLSAGASHSCGIRADRTMACWGNNANNRSNPASAAGVNANTRFLAISAGASHSCGIKADHTMACWGNNANDRSNPASAAGINANTRFLALSAGDSHSCGIRADNTAACWGFDGNGRASPEGSPQGVDANTRFLALSAGSFHSCGIKADGAAACWGSSGNSRTDPTASPQDVNADTRFLALSAGARHSCGIKADGTLACWGVDSNDRLNPTSAAGVDANARFLALSAGSNHSCGIKADGAAVCWGFDGNGRTDPTGSRQGVRRRHQLPRRQRRRRPQLRHQGGRRGRLLGRRRQWSV